MKTMFKILGIFSLLTIIGLSIAACGDGGSGGGGGGGSGPSTPTNNSEQGKALLARTITEGTGEAEFTAVAADNNGIYAVGWQRGTGRRNYGNSITLTGTAGDQNPVLVKYNTSGAAQWARTITAGTVGGEAFSFYSVAVDSSGNVYAAGVHDGIGSYDFGTGVTINGINNFTPILVKYNESGVAQWVKTTGDIGVFGGVTVDSSGNVYAVGWQAGNEEHNYGNDVTLTGTSTLGNPVLVKYDGAGNAEWAKTIEAGTDFVSFYDVAVDSSSVYVTGMQRGTGTYNYGGVTATETGTQNPILIRYNNTTGAAQWARTISAGTGIATFNSVAVDSSGIYVTGRQQGNGTYNYGNSVTARGTATGTNLNPVLVKYNTSGTAQWARTITAGTAGAIFFGIAVDSGGMYVAGYQRGNGTYNYGNSVTATGTATGTNSNPVLVKYGK